MSPAHAARASAQRRPRTPGRRRRRSVVVVAITVVTLAVLSAGAYAALHSRLLAATTVVVTGTRHESPRQVQAAAGLTAAPPMISVDAGQVAARVAHAFPWVASVDVTLHWPRTVDVAVTERKAVAVVFGPNGATELVDVTGRRLGPPALGQVLPRLEYAPPPGQPAGASPTIASSATPGLIVAATLPAAFRSQVAVVQVNRVGWVTLHLDTPVSFVLGPASDLSQKYEDVASVIARTTLHIGDVVDVSVPQAMTVTGP